MPERDSEQKESVILDSDNETVTLESEFDELEDAPQEKKRSFTRRQTKRADRAQKSTVQGLLSKESTYAVSSRTLQITLTILLIASAVFALTGIALRLSLINGRSSSKISAVIGAPATGTADEAHKGAEGSMSGIYADVIIPGTKATIEKGAVLHFGSDKTTFKGFFDNDNPSIAGTYYVSDPPVDSDKKVKAVVAVQKDGKYVAYNLELGDNSDFVLTYPGTDIRMKLEEDNNKSPS